MDSFRLLTLFWDQRDRCEKRTRLRAELKEKEKEEKGGEIVRGKDGCNISGNKCGEKHREIRPYMYFT